MKQGYLFFVISTFFLFSCGQSKKESESNQATREKIDSLEKRIKSLEAKIDTPPVIDSAPDQIHEKKIQIEKKTPAQTRKKEPKPDETIVQTSTKEDTVYYYYKNDKKISVKITPWKNERRKILFYEYSGNLSFEQEDVRASYSVRTELKEFHSNGAIAKIMIHTNPGASMYWYETIITFGEDNIPQWKTEIKHPSTLEDHLNNKSWWDKKTKRWVKQEVIQEQPVPEKYQK